MERARGPENALGDHLHVVDAGLDLARQAVDREAIRSSPISRARAMVSTQSSGDPFTVQSSRGTSGLSCSSTIVDSCICQVRYILKVRSRYSRAAARAASLLAPTISERDAPT